MGKTFLKSAGVIISLLWASLFALPSRPSVLFIGDSNTEKGYLTGALQHFFDTTYAYTGSGYCPFNTTDLTVPYIGFKPFSFVTTIGSTFSQNDMYNVTRPFTPPYPSPDGKWIESSTPGDSVTVRFVGGAIEFYWLSKPNGGSFTAFIDGAQTEQISTAGATSQTKKTTIKGLDTGMTKTHRLKLTVGSGGVTLLGFDVLPDSTGNNKRAVAHNWGNSYCSSVDFKNIDTTVFRTALQALNPDAVVIILGQNDRGDNLDSLGFKNNMTTISQRIRAALPAVDLLLVSSHTRAEPYITWSYQQAAAQTGAKFWDMFTFFLPYANNPAYTQDGGGHINPAGGVICATELWKQLNKNFPTSLGYKSPFPGYRMQDRLGGTRYYLLNGKKATSIGLNATNAIYFDMGHAKAVLHPASETGK